MSFSRLYSLRTSSSALHSFVRLNSTSASTLDATLRTALKGYMKSRASFETGVIKSILADLQNASHLAQRPSPIKTLQKSIQTRLEASSQFRSSSPPRTDLAQQYQQEANFLSQFLPSESTETRLNEDEVRELIRGVVESDFAGIRPEDKMVGKVIKRVLERCPEDKRDGKWVSEVVKKYFKE